MREIKKIEMTPRLIELKLEYDALLHAMQSGVNYSMHNVGAKSVEPKHLRVGINSAMVEAAAIVDFLVDKGIFTYEEYYEYLNAFMKREVDKYARELEEHYGKPKGSVTLA